MTEIKNSHIFIYMKPKTKPIYIEVPEKDHRIFKMFAFSNDMTLQMLIRSSVYYYIRESQKTKD
tara:strand:+ start:799 stop:990 length:192 start_codon:yes stop_codon:yes gene_type:complete